MQLSSRILTALAVLILAVAVVAVRAGSPDTVEAATGDISVLNVGTCYTTNTDAFGVGECDDGDTNSEEDGNEGYNVADRDEISKVDSVYATYAIDPKSSGDQPRAILKHSDIIKISIEDKGRDKRTGVLYAVSGAPDPLSLHQQQIIFDRLDDIDPNLIGDLWAPDDGDAAMPRVFNGLTSAAIFQDDTISGIEGQINNSGDAEFRLTGADSTRHPMAPKDDGIVLWFGVAPDGTANGTTANDFADLSDDYIELDEDLNSGRFGEVGTDDIAPWMRVTASIPATKNIQVQYIYYQTSEKEDLIGGKKDGADYGSENAPVFVDDEDSRTTAAANLDAITLRASADGPDPNQNLWLRETGRFTGVYEGFVRLTDADGDGVCEDETAAPRCNWGLTTKAGTGPTMSDADVTVIGVESGPVKISYRNSKGDNRLLSVMVDKESPVIVVDAPLNDTASTDDSPELIGTFTDGGGSGLREDSFKFYAHNQDDARTDETPIWDFGVHVLDDTNADRGFVCADVDDADGCDAGSKLNIRSNYAGYDDHATYGILKSQEIYKPEADDVNGVDEDTDEDYKTADAEDFEDGASEGEFDTIVRIDFPPRKDDDERYNHVIDLQAVVVDVAGNIGFSDADPTAPNFIADLGTAVDDDRDSETHNVIGWYSRHTYLLDDVDPKFSEQESATGYFLNSEGDPDHNDAGAMVVFDGDVDASTVGIGTFDVELDSGSDATVVDVAVDGKFVYLLLEEELAPNATPKVEIASGQSISDLAGNESTDRRLDGIELSDGILPTFTVTLSGGSGLNEDIDGEGPSELTNKTGIKVSISANEPIQGSPKFVVVCSNLFWDDNADDNNVGEFASQRTGGKTDAEIKKAQPNEANRGAKPAIGDDTRAQCPDHTIVEKQTTGEGATKTYFDVAETSALARPGNNWEYQWSNLTGSDQEVEDGELAVIVWGRDRSFYRRGSKSSDPRVYNYSASRVNFVYDTDLEAAWEGNDDADDDYGELVPAKGENVFEVRPFVLLDFGDEDTTVDVTTFEVDGTDYTAVLQTLEDNEFVWWPEPLAIGTYEVYVEANDAANNTDEETYSFEVKERAPFVLGLLAGWNSISFPANPVDRALHAVFTNTAIDQVIGWNVTEPVSPWRMATRVDGVWTTSEDVATLNDVEARYGYWVHSQGFITQAVDLAGKGDRATDGQPNPSDIPTDEGWNFVGVVDVDGDQTQDDAGETLRNSNNDPITAAEYLGGYTRAYTWDHINNTWDVLKNDEGIVIGTGVWVYYTAGHDIAP